MGFDFVKLSEDFRSIMESVGRTVVTKQTILDIYMNRQALSAAITHEIESVFPKWGIELVNLELKHIKDTEGSSIISDIERKVAAEIKRDAEIRIAETTKETEIARAINEETSRKRQIEKERTIGIAEQQKNQEVSAQRTIANEQEIEALRKLEVGKAEIEKQRVQQQSEAQKIKSSVEAEGQAKQIVSVGQAEADMIKAKKVADAEGTLKLAQAMKEFNDVAYRVKSLDVQRDVLLGKYQALSTIAKEADIKWIMSGANAQSFFGLDLTAEGGANLEQFLGQAGPKVKDILKEKGN